MDMKQIDNVNELLRDDLKSTIKKGSNVSIAAAYFSIYAYRELKKELERVEELRFIFTSPTFNHDPEEKTEKKAEREFYIAKQNRERYLYGTEYEIKLRNEMNQKAIAKECADWIQKKCRFKSLTGNGTFNGNIVVEPPLEEELVYFPVNAFSTADLGCERGNYIFNTNTRLGAPVSTTYLRNFNALWNDESQVQDVTEEVTQSISSAYQENSPEFIYYVILYNIFKEFLTDISEDDLPNEANGFKQSKIWNLLYDFQKDAALAIINKLEKYNGCILADSVGLGKTFTALSVIKYYENRNRSVLVLCPKKLAANWNTYKDNYVNNPIAADRLNYDVLYHTDLGRKKGMSNGLDLGRLNWGNYDLVVIDESHNFRNGIGTHAKTKENRYQRLMEKVIKSGVRTKVLMLSATPVNNNFTDLKNQLALAYEGNSEQMDSKLNTTKTIEEIFSQAQKAFKTWSRLPAERRTTNVLLDMLDFDFFELLDSVTIARSRKHIEKYYDVNAIGQFPTRLKPISKRPSLTNRINAINYSEIHDVLGRLCLSIYTPSNFIFPSKLEKYANLSGGSGNNLTQIGREEGIRRLMGINLLKRLESSVHSFYLTVNKILTLINQTINKINRFEAAGFGSVQEFDTDDSYDFDLDDTDSDLFTIGGKVDIDLRDMDYQSWRNELQQDREILELLVSMIQDITPEYDLKLQTLEKLIEEKVTHPINSENRKILIFSAFADTTEYLYEQLAPALKEKYGLNTAMISGTVDGKSTIKGLKADLNNILTCFSPISKDRAVLMPRSKDEIDVLIATDCISEGQNLQDCDYLVNYDIHWNPVRIIQRFGRIDRIGSRNKYIQLVNFWPDLELDDYINLKSRVETRMKISIMTSTGDDDLINEEEKGDFEYRKQQLKKLQEEVVDIEDMSGGVSIMDLGLNEFRMDLLEYSKTHPSLETMPMGLHAVVKADEDNPEGAIFILKNINNNVNIDNRNRIHPYYMVYMGDDGEVVCDYLNPKALLDRVRLLCKNKGEPILPLCRAFNKETRDGKDMSDVSMLLNDSIGSIIDVKQESDLDSLFSAGGTSALLSDISGLEDFELVCFLVVKKEKE